MPALTPKAFVEKARIRHSNKYSYKKTEYLRSDEYITVTCKSHGDFSVLAGQHVRTTRAVGCAKCASDARKHTASDFIAAAVKQHGTKYDYRKVNYVNSYTKVEIVCKTHGSFWQTPGGHLHNQNPSGIIGSGCPTCGGERRYLLNMERDLYGHPVKHYQLGKRKVKVQGYEPQALDYIQKNLKIPASDILVGRKVPRIRYYDKTTGKTRTYFPDAYVVSQHRLVEVKSTYTFKTGFTNLVIKRKAAIKRGFKFSLLVMDKDGNRIRVPEDWYLAKGTENYFS